MALITWKTEISLGNVSEMTYFVLSGTQNKKLNQSLCIINNLALTFGLLCITFVCRQLSLSQGDLKTILLILNENLQEPGPEPPSPASVPAPRPESPAKKTPVTPTGRCDTFYRVFVEFPGFYLVTNR